MMHMDSPWMGAAMVVHAVLAVVLVAAIVYLCISAGRYLRVKTAESTWHPRPPEA